jgi:hypothetical protein
VGAARRLSHSSSEGSPLSRFIHTGMPEQFRPASGRRRHDWLGEDPERRPPSCGAPIGRDRRDRDPGHRRRYPEPRPISAVVPSGVAGYGASAVSTLLAVDTGRRMPTRGGLGVTRPSATSTQSSGGSQPGHRHVDAGVAHRSCYRPQGTRGRRYRT